MSENQDPAAGAGAGTDPKPNPPAEQNKAPKEVEARLLVDHEFGKSGHTVKVPAARIKAMVKAGEADDHPDAVAYGKKVAKAAAKAAAKDDDALE